MIAKNLRLPRLRIKYVLHKGKKINIGGFAVRHLASGADNSRFCVVISTKVAPKAVDRNRLRRQIYETIRLNGDISGRRHCDMVIIGMPETAKIKQPALKNNIIEIINSVTNQYK